MSANGFYNRSKPVSAYVESARRRAELLEKLEMLWADVNQGDARKAVSVHTGIPASFLASLRHRPPKTIDAGIVERICTAIESAAQRNIKRLEHELETARQCRRRLGDSDLAEIEALLVTARRLLPKTRGSELKGD